MLSAYEIPEYISIKLPEIENDLHEIELEGNIYKSIQILTDYSKKMVLSNDFKKLGKCLELAEKIYQKGNTEVKTAIKNVFILSFSCLKLACDEAEWRIVLSSMPPTLYGLHLNQIRVQAIFQ